MRQNFGNNFYQNFNQKYCKNGKVFKSETAKKDP